MDAVMFRFYSGMLCGSPDRLKRIILEVAAEDPDVSVADFIMLQAVAWPDQVKVIVI